jgi:hypothetical protein
MLQVLPEYKIMTYESLFSNITGSQRKPVIRFFFVRFNFSCSKLWFYLPSEIHVCCCCLLLCGTDEKCNFSAVRSPIKLKLGGDLGVSGVPGRLLRSG